MASSLPPTELNLSDGLIECDAIDIGDGVGSILVFGSGLMAVLRPRERGFGFGLGICAGVATLPLLPYNGCDPYPNISCVGLVMLLNDALNALLFSSIDDAVFSRKLNVDSPCVAKLYVSSILL